MKLLLLIITSFLLNHLQADTFSLPDQSFSVNAATGAWSESAIEGSTRRVWDGKKWNWEGKPNPAIHQIAEKKLIKVNRPGKAPVTYLYDNEGKITYRSEGQDRYIRIQYDTKGRVRELHAPLGKDGSPRVYSSYLYGDKNTVVHNALGHKKVYYWNGSHEVTQIDTYNEKGLYKVERIQWNNGKIVKQSLSDGNGKEIISQTNTWEKGRVVKQTVTGNLTGRGKVESYTETFKYDSNGNLKKVIDQNNKEIVPAVPSATLDDKTVYQHDTQGRVISKTSPNGECESYSWDIYDNLISRTTSKTGKEVRFKYDLMNRLIGESDGFSFEYDLLGQQTKLTDPEGNETEFVYDALGRKISMIQPAVLDSQGKSIRPKTQWVYNEQDQLIETIDPDGWSTKTFYTARGQVYRIEHPDGRIEEQFYQLNGQIEGFVEPKPVEEEKVIDETPPLDEESVDPCHTDRVYNERGQKVLQKSFTDFTGIRTVRTFDALERVEKVEKYDLLGNLFQLKEFRYTPGGLKAVEMTDGHTIEWIWGPQERLDALFEDRGTADEKRTYLYYNSDGKLERYVKPSGLTLNYIYEKSGALSELFSSEGSVHYEFYWNEQGRLREARDYLSGNSTYRFYDEEGQLVREILANGLEITWEKEALLLPDRSRLRYHRDNKNILKSISREDKEGHKLYSHDYTHFDALGQLTHENLILGIGEVSYGRDKEQRITSVSSPFRSEKIRYDGLQLTDITVGDETTHFEYDAQFRLKKKENPKVWFDRDGNITHNSSHRFDYDALGHLIAVDCNYYYEYDAFGRRISRLDNTSGETTYYLWDGMEEIGATNQDREFKELKVMGSHGVVAVELEGVPYAAIKDSQGTIVELASINSNSPKSPWTYQGKREDKESGLIYFGARFLDPVRGQFLTPDPKGFQDGNDVYQFARSNPHAYTDAWGHLSIMNSFSSLLKAGRNALKEITGFVSEYRSWINELSGTNVFIQRMEELTTLCLGKSFLVEAGLNKQPLQTGVFGSGELNDHVRVTFNHGIINTRTDLANNLRQISTSHGGVNVHYVYRPTNGLGKDLVKCLFVKSGYMSPEAKELLRIWKGLIEEMGGVNGGGKIVHYAHSAGGADTWNALRHLTPEEQKMFDIRTFGSATLVPDIGTYTAVNYVSKRDGVTLLVDPFTWFMAYAYNEGNTVFLGTFKGIPLADHPLSNESYQEVIRALGQAFLATYGSN